MVASESLDGEIKRWTDQYFNKTREIVLRNGDVQVTYAIFMRRPVSFAPRLMIEWLDRIAEKRNTKFEIETCFKEGAWAGAGAAAQQQGAMARASGEGRSGCCGPRAMRARR